MMEDREEYLIGRIKKMEEDLEKAEDGAREIQMLVDGLLIHLVREYGVKADGGYKMSLPAFNAKELINRYEVSVKKDDFTYVLQIVRRSEE